MRQSARNTPLLPRRRMLAAAAVVLVAAVLAPTASVSAAPAADAPSGLSAALVDGVVTLSWDAPASDDGSVTGYQILRRRPGIDPIGSFTAIVDNTAAADTDYVDRTADEPGGAYTYRVKAWRNGTLSSQSNYSRVDLPANYTAPANPNTDNSDGGDGNDDDNSDNSDDGDGNDDDNSDDGDGNGDGDGDGDNAAAVPFDWQATLTVGAGGSRAGYFFIGSMGALEPSTFTVGDTGHTVYALGVASDSVYLALWPTLPDGFTLTAGDHSLDSADATHTESDVFFLYQWDNPGLDWNADDTVAVTIANTIGSGDENDGDEPVSLTKTDAVVSPYSSQGTSEQQACAALSNSADVLQQCHLPDANLRAAIEDALGKNAGDHITLGDMTSLTTLDAGFADIASATGIEHATNLTRLELGWNDLTSVDVSALTKLTWLEVQGNDLTSVDVSALTKLFWLNVSHNKLTSIDVSGLTKLVEFKIYDNELTSLDVSGISALIALHADNNKLTSVTGLTDHPDLHWLDLSYNKLTSFDVSGISRQLVAIYARNNDLTQITGLTDVDALEYLILTDNDFASINLTGLNDLSLVFLQDNPLSEADVIGRSSIPSLIL